MKNSLPIILLTISIALGACSKNSLQTEIVTSPVTTNPDPNTAKISGIIAPLDMAKIVSVTVTNVDNGTSYTGNPDDTGIFTISNLAGGMYQVAINSGSNMAKINLTPITLSSGQTKNLQTITLAVNNPNGYIIKGTSTITGTVSPATGGSFVYAYHKQLLYQYVGTIDANGKFVIKDLPEGSYFVNVNATTNFTAVAMAALELDLGVNQTVDAGSFSFTNNTDHSTLNYLSYELDDVTKYRDQYNKSFYALSKFGLYTYTTASVYNIQTGLYNSVVADRLDIALDGITGPGTYSCKGTASIIRVTHREIAIKEGPLGSGVRIAGPISVWSTTGLAGTGTITITAVDLVNKTVSGTFTAITVPESGEAKGNRLITNGTFSNYKYEEAIF